MTCGAEGDSSVALSRTKFNELVEQHGPALYRTAYRLVGDPHQAEDLVQETYRSAWRNRQGFEVGRGDRAWLVAILRRRAADYWRRRRMPVLPSDRSPDPAVEPDDPLRDEYSDEMQHALNQLPEELRESLLLVVVAELTHQETANLLDVPLGTILSRVSRARKRMREILVAAKDATGQH
jgi:RNA polymerase sigma-70 factor (ECF subfamily)